MTPTASDETDTPKRAFIAAGIAAGSHALVLLAAFAVAAIVPESDGGWRALGALVFTMLAGEIITGLAAVIVSAVQFRRGRPYTGVGLMGGWLVGFVPIALLLFT